MGGIWFLGLSLHTVCQCYLNAHRLKYSRPELY